MIRAVTIERKFGCGNSEIAAKLAELLGWKLWDQELTQEIAHLTNGTPQVVEQLEWENDPTAYRVFKSFVRKGIRGGPAGDRSAGNRWPRLAIFSSRVARVCFECSCVLSRTSKIHRLITAGTTQEEAITDVDTIDRDRAAFVKRYLEKCLFDASSRSDLKRFQSSRVGRH
jgi:hypothetical protein